MARLKKDPSKVRSKQIIAKVTPSEHERVARAARRKKMTNSEFLRTCVGLK